MDANEINLVEPLSKKKDGQNWLEELGKTVWRRVDEDEKGRKDHMDRIAQHRKKYLGAEERMDKDVGGGRKPNVPIVTKACIHIWGRIYTAAVKPDFFHVEETGGEDQERAQRIEQHGRWEIRAKHPEWARGMSNSIMRFAVDGSMARYVGWDPVAQKKIIEGIAVDDFVIPYARQIDDPMMADVPHKTRKVRKYRRELDLLAERGYFAGVDKLFSDEDGLKAKPENPRDDKSPVREVNEQAEGVEAPENREEDGEGKYLLYEQHCWGKVPGDLRDRPLVVFIEESTKKVLRVVYREYEDPIDRRRYENELLANKLEYEALMGQFEETMKPQMDPDGMPMPLPPDLTPPEMKQPEPVRMLPDESFVLYTFFPNPDAALGLGIGALCEGHNEIANTLIAETILAARLNCRKQILAARGTKLDKKPQEMPFGRITFTDCTQEDLQRAFYTLEFAPPNPVMLQIANMFEEYAESSTQTHPVTTGEPGPSRETATSFKARFSAAQVSLGVIVEQFFASFSCECKLYGRRNALNMPDQEIFYVTEPDPLDPQASKKVQKTISRLDYLEDYDITFTADGRFVSDEQRIDECTGARALILQDPDLQKIAPLRVKAAKKLLSAMHMGDLVTMIPDNAGEPEEPKPMSQEDENAGFIREQYHPALPDDDHPTHKQSILIFQATPFFGQMSPTGKQMLDRHEREHDSFLYQRFMEETNGQGLQGLPSGGAPGMAGGPGDGGVPGNAPGAPGDGTLLPGGGGGGGNGAGMPHPGGQGEAAPGAGLPVR